MKQLFICLLPVLAMRAEAAAETSVNIQYAADIMSNLEGGLGQETRYLDLFQADLTWSAESHPTDIFLSAIHSNGEGFSEDVVGDAQGVSNIETGFETTRLYEAWAAHQLGDTNILVGLYDVNRDFDVLDSANLFLNGAYGIGTDIGQSGNNGPSIYPFTGLGVRVSHAYDQTTFRLAILDGVPGDQRDPRRVGFDLRADEGAFFIGEVDVSLENGKLLLGGWRYSSDLQWIVDETRRETSHGIYLRGEQQFGDGNGWKSPVVFARAGLAQSDTNLFDNFLSAGLVVNGPLSTRPNDQFGFAISYASVSDVARSTIMAPALGSQEINLELTYAAKLSESFSIQPNLQWIASPSGVKGQDALVAGIRLDISAKLWPTHKPRGRKK